VRTFDFRRKARIPGFEELTFKLLKILVDCCEPSPFINGSLGASSAEVHMVADDHGWLKEKDEEKVEKS
jgi:hypothetical protein